MAAATQEMPPEMPPADPEEEPPVPRDRPFWLTTLNSDDMPEMKPTPEQFHLFDDYHCFTLDNGSLTCHVRIHKRLVLGQVKGDCSIFLHWPGGGFTTGANALFRPWWKVHLTHCLVDETVIMVCPRYTLMPESTGAEMENDVDHFLKWMFGGVLDREIRAICKNVRSMYGRKMLVSGESAGAHWAFYTWLQCQKFYPDIDIGVMYLQYPMLEAYTREPGQDYRGKIMSAQHCGRTALKVLIEIAKGNAYMQPRKGDRPPFGMGLGHVLSTTRIKAVINNEKPRMISTWLFMYQHLSVNDRVRAFVKSASKEHLEAREASSGLNEVSVRELVEELDARGLALGELGARYIPEHDAVGIDIDPADKEAPEFCPSIYITHGTADTNCPIVDSVRFVQMMHEVYPDGDFQLFPARGKTHGFDYLIEDEYIRSATNSVNSAMNLPVLQPAGGDKSDEGSDDEWSGSEQSYGEEPGAIWWD